MTTDRGFGTCCADMIDAMTTPPQPLFRVEDDGVFFMAVGYAQTDRGVGWFEHAVLYCPFCGTQLQDRAEIAARGGGRPTDDSSIAR